MKMNKLVCSLAFALAVTLASTGCRHQPVGVTHIPGSTVPQPPSDTANLNTLPYNPPPSTSSSETSTGIPMNGSWDPANMIQDASALAANTIHFAYDSAVIRDSDQANLQAVAQALNADPNVKLLIQGNCDERGTEEYNRSLGERRADAAREALSKLGVDPQRIRTISFGKDKPVDPGHGSAAWSKNRRDDFVLCHPKSGV
jgi:peptidoglycan-associated lipoprotein